MKNKITNKYHKQILELIVSNSGKPTQHTYSDSYLGNDHKRYPISAPVLRTIAKKWMKEHDLDPHELVDLLTSLIQGESSTEKCMVGILLDCSKKTQRKFPPRYFDQWLDHLVGWAEVDSVCTGKYTMTEVPDQWEQWEKLLTKFSKSKNINKRRASLVIFCSPVSQVRDERLCVLAFENIDKLKHEKEVLITKAISWVLRSMIKHYRKEVTEYLNKEPESLPKIAVRETMVKLKTGRKTTKK